MAKSTAARLVQTDSRTPDEYRVEEQIGYLFRRTHQRATSIFMDLIGAEGLTPTKFAALVKIADLGEVSQNHLGRLTAMDPATSQGVIRRLEAQGLIERSADAGDKRRTILRLTPAGTALVDATVPNAQKITAETLAPLDAAEQRTLLALLQKLI